MPPDGAVRAGARQPVTGRHRSGKMRRSADGHRAMRIERSTRERAARAPCDSVLESYDCLRPGRRTPSRGTGAMIATSGRPRARQLTGSSSAASTMAMNGVRHRTARPARDAGQAAA